MSRRPSVTTQNAAGSSEAERPPTQLQLRMARDIVEYMCRRSMHAGDHVTEQELVDALQGLAVSDSRRAGPSRDEGDRRTATESRVLSRAGQRRSAPGRLRAAEVRRGEASLHDCRRLVRESDSAFLLASGVLPTLFPRPLDRVSSPPEALGRRNPLAQPRTWLAIQSRRRRHDGGKGKPCLPHGPRTGGDSIAGLRAGQRASPGSRAAITR